MKCPCECRWTMNLCEWTHWWMGWEVAGLPYPTHTSPNRALIHSVTLTEVLNHLGNVGMWIFQKCHRWMTEMNADFYKFEIFLTDLQFSINFCQFKKQKITQGWFQEVNPSTAIVSCSGPPDFLELCRGKAPWMNQLRYRCHRVPWDQHWCPSPTAPLAPLGGSPLLWSLVFKLFLQLKRFFKCINFSN